MLFNFFNPAPVGQTDINIESGASTIFVGANGGGKTRLAAYIEDKGGLMRLVLPIASMVVLAACAGSTGPALNTVIADQPQQNAPQENIAMRSPAISVAYDKNRESFLGTKLNMVKLALRAIQELGWKVEKVNENVGLVSFETPMSFGSWSGISATLLIEEVSPNTFRVTGTAKQNTRGGQLAAFDIGGEAQSRVREAIEKMKTLASNNTTQ